MLTELHIEDLGVISTLEMVLGPGLTALTGETGAGKTMLVEAISLLVGGRADATMIRPSAHEARVEGRFVVDDDEYILARVIPRDGRSRAYLNGRLATVATLSEVGRKLVDLHGQHAHQSLLGTATQRAALDRYGSVDLSALRTVRARLTEIDAALAALGGDSRSRAREIDLLRFQVGEIQAAGIQDGNEEHELDEAEDVLAGAVAHREAGNAALGVLVADEGAIDQIGRAIAALGSRSPFHGVSDRLRGAAADVADAAGELRDISEGIDEDPQRLMELRERRQLLRDLRRKYGDTLSDVIQFHTEAAHRLDELERYDARALALDSERTVALREEQVTAAAVGAARRASAPLLAGAVRIHLRELAMPHADVSVQVGDDPGDDVSFLLAANPGSPLLPLTRVASGGELARSMLALRLVLSDDPATLVFDEVDAGVGGSAAIAVGNALAQLAEQHQVLVVTHLAQVAACATAQIVVSKRVQDGVTFAQAVPVDGEARIDEIARMMSGMSQSKSARDHAVELLSQRHRAH